MKLTDLLLFILGVILIYLQYVAYKHNDFRIPGVTMPMLDLNSIIIVSSKIIGFNIFGFIGLFLVIYITEKNKRKFKDYN
jgi:hypothetical protein